MFEAKFEGRDRLRDAGVQMSVMFIFRATEFETMEIQAGQFCIFWS